MKNIFDKYIYCITDTTGMDNLTYHLFSLFLITIAIIFSMVTLYAPWIVLPGCGMQVIMSDFYSSIGNIDTIHTILKISAILSVIFYIATWVAYAYNNETLMLVYGILWRVLSGFILVEIVIFILIGIICDVMPFVFCKLPMRLFSKKEEVYKIEDNWHTRNVSYSEYMDYKLNETINGLSKFIMEK